MVLIASHVYEPRTIVGYTWINLNGDGFEIQMPFCGPKLQNWPYLLGNKVANKRVGGANTAISDILVIVFPYRAVYKYTRKKEDLSKRMTVKNYYIVV